MLLEHLKWTQLAGLGDCVFVAPLGALEQHGHHLPLSTDAVIVGEIAHRLEARLSGRIVLAPVQWLGHSPHHARFGCVSLNVRPYMDLILGICRSLAAMGARRIFLLNGHGGNDAPVKAALCEIKTEMPSLAVAFASYWTLAAEPMARIRESPPGGMGHACEMETSIMMALQPDRVSLADAVDASTAGRPKYQVLDMQRPQPYYMVRNFDELSPSGTLGMPSLATREKGEQFLEAITGAVADFVAAFGEWSLPA